MTDSFKCIYQILRTLEAAMDLPEFDISQINCEKLGISRERWGRYIEMMSDAGYIKGVNVYSDCLGNTCVDNKGIRITLKGLEYLSEKFNYAETLQISNGNKRNRKITVLIQMRTVFSCPKTI